MSKKQIINILTVLFNASFTNAEVISEPNDGDTEEMQKMKLEASNCLLDGCKRIQDVLSKYADVVPKLPAGGE